MRAELTRARFPAELSNGNDSSALPGSFWTQYARLAQICRREECLQQNGMPLPTALMSLEWLEGDLPLTAYIS